MRFLDRIQNGFTLALSSFKVLRQDPELILFPLASGVSCTLVLAGFVLPMIGMGDGYFESLADDQVTGSDILSYVLLFLYYFINFFIIIFFNSALVSCAIIRFKGGNPTVGDGIRSAMSSIHYIALWALVAATVGLILKAIESRSEGVGRFIAGLLGAGWSILTFFVVPVLVVEHRTPWDALTRSKNLMLKTWGETLSASFGLGIIKLVIFLIGAIPIFVGAGMLASSGLAGGVLIAVGVVAILSGILCTSALESILLASLYLYAEEGQIPDAYDGDTFRRAFE